MKRTHKQSIQIILNTAVLYLGLLAILFFVLLSFQPVYVDADEIVTFSLTTFLIAFAVTFFVLFLLLKYVKRSFLFKSLFAFILFTGTWMTASVFFDALSGFIIAFTATWIAFLFPIVWVHNAILGLAVIGISFSLGFSFPFLTLVFLLFIFAIYDIIAVFVTKHMVTMFRTLQHHGMLLAFILPLSLSGWKESLSHAQERPIGYVGTGDFVFAFMISTAIYPISTIAFFCLSLGALLGLMSLQFYLLYTKSQRPWPALPAICLGCILGFLVYISFFYS